MFDEPTRVGNQQNLRGYGDAFAGRGDDLNRAIAGARAAGPATPMPVLSNIAGAGDQLPALLRVAGRTAARSCRAGRGDPAASCGPTSPHAARLRRRGAAVPPGARSRKGPSGLETAIETFPTLRPFFERHGSSSPSCSPAPARCALRAPRPRATRSRRASSGLEAVGPASTSRLTGFLRATSSASRRTRSCRSASATWSRP